MKTKSVIMTRAARAILVVISETGEIALLADRLHRVSSYRVSISGSAIYLLFLAAIAAIYVIMSVCRFLCLSQMSFIL